MGVQECEGQGAFDFDAAAEQERAAELRGVTDELLKGFRSATAGFYERGGSMVAFGTSLDGEDTFAMLDGQTSGPIFLDIESRDDTLKQGGELWTATRERDGSVERWRLLAQNGVVILGNDTGNYGPVTHLVSVERIHTSEVQVQPAKGGMGATALSLVAQRRLPQERVLANAG